MRLRWALRDHRQIAGAARFKDNIDKPWAVFTSLRIPVYAVWDSDASKSGKERDRAIGANRLLQKLVGAPEPYVDHPSCVAANFACFEDNLETTLQAEIGGELYNDLLEKAVFNYDLPKRDNAKKNPAVMSQILAEAAQKGVRSATLEAVVSKVFDIGLLSDLSTSLGVGRLPR